MVEGLDALIITDSDPEFVTIPEGVKIVVYIDCDLTHSPPLPDSVVLIGFQHCIGMTMIEDLPVSVQKLYIFELQTAAKASLLKIRMPDDLRSVTLQTQRPVKFMGPWPRVIEELVLIDTSIVKSDTRIPKETKVIRRSK